jgi:hypothetical protein
MNKDRRDAIKAVIKVLDRLPDWDDMQATVEALRDEEQEYFDNIPESLQGGDRGMAAESAIQFMDEAISAIENAREAIEEITNNLEEATA